MSYAAYLAAVQVFQEARAAYETKTSPPAAAAGRVSYGALTSLYRAMRAAEEEAQVRGSYWKGRGHWAPSCWDSDLPLALAVEARDIGLRLRQRLEAEWSEAYKCSLLDTESFLEGKEQHRILVAAYLQQLPDDDPDVVLYEGLRSRAHLFYLPAPPAAGEGQSRAARARRNKRRAAAAAAAPQ